MSSTYDQASDTQSDRASLGN